MSARRKGGKGAKKAAIRQVWLDVIAADFDSDSFTDEEEDKLPSPKRCRQRERDEEQEQPFANTQSTEDLFQVLLEMFPAAPKEILQFIWERHSPNLQAAVTHALALNDESDQPTSNTNTPKTDACKSSPPPPPALPPFTSLEDMIEGEVAWPGLSSTEANFVDEFTTLPDSEGGLDPLSPSLQPIPPLSLEGDEEVALELSFEFSIGSAASSVATSNKPGSRVCSFQS